MFLKSKNEIQISALPKNHAKADLSWRECHLDRCLTITISGETPLSITEAMSMASDLQKKIKDTIWQHYVASEQATKPSTLAKSGK